MSVNFNLCPIEIWRRWALETVLRWQFSLAEAEPTLQSMLWVRRVDYVLIIRFDDSLSDYSLLYCHVSFSECASRVRILTMLHQVWWWSIWSQLTIFSLCFCCCFPNEMSCDLFHHVKFHAWRFRLTKWTGVSLVPCSFLVKGFQTFVICFASWWELKRWRACFLPGKLKTDDGSWSYTTSDFSCEAWTNL